MLRHLIFFFAESVEWWKHQCADIDMIIHVAWYAEPGKYLDSTQNMDCLIGSLNLAKAAMLAGVKRFVGVGTCFEYDLTAGFLSVDTPINRYHRTHDGKGGSI